MALTSARKAMLLFLSLSPLFLGWARASCPLPPNPITNLDSLLVACPTNLNSCTANDVVTTALNATVNPPNQLCNALFNNQIELDLLLKFDPTANERYDLGIWIATTGGSLQSPVTATQCVGTAAMVGDGVPCAYPDADNDTFIDLDPRADKHKDTVPDTCGDLSTAQGPVNWFVHVTVSCSTVVNGILYVPSCRVWENNAQHPISCTSLAQAGTGSKCDCTSISLANILDPCVTAGCPSTQCQTATCHLDSNRNPICGLQNKTDGTNCTDGNKCTTVDTCQGGVCHGAIPIVCTALDQCHNAGTCDPLTGNCSNPTKTEGTTCEKDGDLCTFDKCVGGICSNYENKTCPLPPADKPCWLQGTCVPSTGLCTQPYKTPGTGCDDGLFCTSNTSCDLTGTCTGAIPTDCTAGNPPAPLCQHWECNETAKACQLANDNNNSPCTTGQFCLTNGTCQAGSCVEVVVVCNAPIDTQCQLQSCNPNSGCTIINQTDGTPCDTGIPATTCDPQHTCVIGHCQTHYPNNHTTCHGVPDKCENQWTCDGQGTCVPNGFLNSTTQCADCTGCIPATFCNGTSASCPPPPPPIPCVYQNCSREACSTTGCGCVQNPPNCTDPFKCTNDDCDTATDACVNPFVECPPAGTAPDQCVRWDCVEPSKSSLSAACVPTVLVGQTCTLNDKCFNNTFKTVTYICTADGSPHCQPNDVEPCPAPECYIPSCSEPNGCAVTFDDNAPCKTGDKCYNWHCDSQTFSCVQTGPITHPDDTECIHYICDPAVGWVPDVAFYNGTACGNQTTGSCRNTDICVNGLCVSGNFPRGTICQQASSCANASLCDGDGTCIDYLLPDGTPCQNGLTEPSCGRGSLSDSQCYTHQCSAGGCLIIFSPGTTVCRNSTGECDLPEYCSAGCCPADALVPSGTQCGTPARGSCEVNTTCTGVGVDCPPSTGCLPSNCPHISCKNVACAGPESCGCTYTDVVYDDGNACNGYEYCLNDIKYVAILLDCSAETVSCTDDSCNSTLPYAGPATVTLVDGSVIAVSNQLGACVHTPNNANCPYTDLCNPQHCDLLLGCVVDPQSCPEVSDPTNKCLIQGVCNSSTGLCSPESTKQCYDADNDRCTSYECDTTTGICVQPLITCDDKNACTVDSCENATFESSTHYPNSSGCKFTAVPCDYTSHPICQRVTDCVAGVPCVLQYVNEDPDCTAKNTFCQTWKCDAGQCVPDVTTNCDDGNVCTTDSCDPDNGCMNVHIPGCCNTNQECDDGIFCNGNETCVDHACQPGSEPDCSVSAVCSYGYCNREKDACDQQDFECVAPDACHTATCTGLAEGRAYTQTLACPTDASCDYIDVWNSLLLSTRLASDGVCSNFDANCQTPFVAGINIVCSAGGGPQLNSTTDLGTVCHTPVCVYNPIPSCCLVNQDCDDGQFCNGNETCKNNTCIPGTPPTCNDDVNCTVDSCDPAAANGHGACVDTPQNDLCEAGNVCQNATCDPSNTQHDLAGCVYTTIPDCCITNGDCLDPNRPFCDPSTNKCKQCLVHADCLTLSNFCDPWVCTNFQCVSAGTPTLCPTTDPCNPEVCDPTANNNAGACVITPIPNCCTTDNNCTGGTFCQPEICNTTSNTCILGPRTEPCCESNTECDDGIYCNGTETCVDNVCKPGTPPDCSDNNNCTIDTCVDTKTCQSGSNQGNICTVPEDCPIPNPCISTGDYQCCSNGNPTLCAPALYPDSTCNNQCRLGQSCFEKKVCESGQSCNNNIPCPLLIDGCQINVSLSCRHTPVVPVDDHINCTVDACDPATGATIHTPNNSYCGTNGCFPATCSPISGCSNTTYNCSDGLKCTYDVCVSVGGQAICTYTNVTCPDTDNRTCTVEACNPSDGLCHIVSDTCCANCVLTHGYWKNHISDFQAALGGTGANSTWAQLTLDFCGRAPLTILQTSASGGDLWYQLAYQYLATLASLNSGLTHHCPGTNYFDFPGGQCIQSCLTDSLDLTPEPDTGILYLGANPCPAANKPFKPAVLATNKTRAKQCQKMLYNFVNGYGVTCPDGTHYAGLEHCSSFSDPVSAQLLGAAVDSPPTDTTTTAIEPEHTASDTWILVGWVALLIVLIAAFIGAFVFFNAYAGVSSLEKAKGGV